MIVKHTTNRPFLIKWYMVFLGFRGLTTPWGVIYYDSLKSLNDIRLRRHELKHAEQMEREGIIKFLIKYNWYWITKGYTLNPYEVEARAAANEL